MPRRAITCLRLIEWLMPLLLIVFALVALKHVGESRQLRGAQAWKKASSIWVPIMLCVPLMFIWASRLISLSFDRRDALSADRRFAIASILLLGVLSSLAFRPDDGLNDPTVMGVFVPSVLYCLSIYLWLRWADVKAIGRPWRRLTSGKTV